MTTNKPGFSSKTCPITATFVRDFREVFGDNVRVLMVDEGPVEHDPEKRLPEWREKLAKNGECNGTS